MTKGRWTILWRWSLEDWEFATGDRYGLFRYWMFGPLYIRRMAGVSPEEGRD